MPKKRTQLMQVKVTEAEKNHVKFVADRKGVSGSALLRMAFFEYAERHGMPLKGKEPGKQ